MVPISRKRVPLTRKQWAELYKMEFRNGIGGYEATFHVSDFDVDARV
jgi:hypothetical protein